MSKKSSNKKKEDKASTQTEVKPVVEDKKETKVEPASQEVQTEEHHHKHLHMWAALFVGLAIGLFVVLLLVKIGAIRNSQSTISGSIVYNGLMPSSFVGGSIVVEARDVETNEEFSIIDQDIPIQRNSSWSWETAHSGATYQIQAYMQIDGNKVSVSSSVVVTAPANDQKLVFNVTQDELDKYDIPSNAADNQATISGTLDINGYIPEGSTVTILRKVSTATEYSVTKTGIPAVDGTALSWQEAESGQTYDFVGVLVDSQSTKIGQSQPLKITAPSTGNTLRIDSQATPPAPVTSFISGTVQINGPIATGTKVVMKQKLTSESEFKEFQTLNAVNGVSWQLGELQSGSTYDITATLVEAGQEISNGTVITATAPATDEVILINVGASVPAPKYAPTVSCGTLQGDSVGVTVSVNSVENALQYFLEVGTQPRTGDTFAQLIQSLQQEVTIAPNQTYYTGYAYSLDSSCTDAGCFSGLSPELAFQCTDSGANLVPMPY